MDIFSSNKIINDVVLIDVKSKTDKLIILIISLIVFWDNIGMINLIESPIKDFISVSKLIK